MLVNVHALRVCVSGRGKVGGGEGGEKEEFAFQTAFYMK